MWYLKIISCLNFENEKKRFCSTLWLAQTTSKDTGIYTCMATNIAGNVSMVARVTVQGELFSIQIILLEVSNMKQL